MDQEQTRSFSAIAGLLLEIAAQQMAILSLLKKQEGIGEEKTLQAITAARQKLGSYSGLASIRSKMNVDNLEAFEKVLRGILSHQK